MPAMASRRTWMAMMAGLVACVRPAAGQRRVSIAVTEFSGDPVSDEVSPRSITEIIISDLKASGRLALIEPHGLVEDNIDSIPQFDKWRSINADGLVTGCITPKPDQHILVQFRLWDVAIGQQLAGAQYGLPLQDWQRVPHVIADAILDRLVGRT